MAQHALLTHATRRPYSAVPNLPEGAFYDPAKGYWILRESPLVQSPEFLANRTSKKCDQETGEDQKGE